MTLTLLQPITPVLMLLLLLHNESLTLKSLPFFAIDRRPYEQQQQVFTNCKVFNKFGSAIWYIADYLQAKFERLFQVCLPACVFACVRVCVLAAAPLTAPLLLLLVVVLTSTEALQPLSSTSSNSILPTRNL